MNNSEFTVRIENAVLHLMIGSLDFSGGDRAALTTHTHLLSELFVCGAGRAVIKVPDGFLTLREGDAAIVPPGIFHALHRTDPGTRGCAFRFHCFKRRGGGDLHGTLLPFISGDRILVYRDQPRFWNTASEIIRQAKGGPGFMPALTLAGLLVAAADSSGPESRSKHDGGALRQGDLQLVTELDDLFSEVYSKRLDAKEIAKRLNVSGRHLFRLTRKVYGKTPHELVADMRIRAAEQLLGTTDMTVAKIAFEVGFGSVTGLYREFEKRHGATPTEYRKQSPK